MKTWKKASVLFIYPPVSFSERNPLSGFSPPLGVLYLATILKNRGHEVHVIDVEAERLSLRELTRRVKSIHPDVVGLTCLTYTLESCKIIIREIRDEVPYIVVGGPHLAVAPTSIGADAYVIGEAEMVIEKIVEERPTGIVVSKEAKSIDIIPPPNRSLVEQIEYGNFYELKFGKKATAILTSRGCRYGCSFCNRPKKLSFRVRSPKNIVQELKEIERAGYETVWLADDNFTNDPKNVIKIASLIRKEKIELDFFGQARVDVPSEALYRSFKEMGVIGLSFGVESLNPEVIKWYNKTKYPSRWPSLVKKTLNLCHKHGIISIGSLIFGAPMETKKDMEHSIDFLEENGADLINGNVLLYLVGSNIWHRAVREEKINTEQFMVSAPEAGLTPYSQEELEELCIRCSKYSKERGWFRCLLKLLKNHRYKIIYSTLREGVERYSLAKKTLLSEGHGYGYGKRKIVIREGGEEVDLSKIKSILEKGERFYHSLSPEQRDALTDFSSAVGDVAVDKIGALAKPRPKPERKEVKTLTT